MAGIVVFLVERHDAFCTALRFVPPSPAAIATVGCSARFLKRLAAHSVPLSRHQSQEPGSTGAAFAPEPRHV